MKFIPKVVLLIGALAVHFVVFGFMFGIVFGFVFGFVFGGHRLRVDFWPRAGRGCGRLRPDGSNRITTRRLESHRDQYDSPVTTVSPERFEELVGDALAGLPEQFARAMENVAVVVEDHAPGRDLFGLYQGVPLTNRGPMSYSGVMPDRITLYQDTISEHCHGEEQLVAQIRKTVIHEIAHHFGIGDTRLEELGWA